MIANAIDLDSVAKSYSGKTVIADVSLSVKSGEYFGLVGMNGAGKTTLMKSLLDLCAINAGSIQLFGINHREQSARDCLSYLPEKFVPPYYLTGRNYLEYMAELNGQPYVEAKLVELLAVLDLETSALDKPVRQFSKGMGQKLGLAACLYSNKKLLIFDEPMSGLDPRARAYLKQYLAELKGSGKTLFCSTHLLEDVAALCDRMAILHEGEIRFVGTPQECCDSYDVNDLEQAYLACTGTHPHLNPPP